MKHLQDHIECSLTLSAGQWALKTEVVSQNDRRGRMEVRSQQWLLPFNRRWRHILQLYGKTREWPETPEYYQRFVVKTRDSSAAATWSRWNHWVLICQDLLDRTVAVLISWPLNDKATLWPRYDHMLVIRHMVMNNYRTTVITGRQLTHSPKWRSIPWWFNTSYKPRDVLSEDCLDQMDQKGLSDLVLSFRFDETTLGSSLGFIWIGQILYILTLFLSPCWVMAASPPFPSSALWWRWSNTKETFQDIHFNFWWVQNVHPCTCRKWTFIGHFRRRSLPVNVLGPVFWTRPVGGWWASQHWKCLHDGEGRCMRMGHQWHLKAWRKNCTIDELLLHLTIIQG